MMLKLTALFLVVVAASASLAHAKSLSPIVEVAQGKLQGLEAEVLPGIYSFKNIPFAQPPIGQRRLADPLPGKPWSGVLNATVFGPGCPTIYSDEAFPDKFCRPRTMSEDCLNLNVYTPSLSPSAKKLPVAVFFYGGDYDFGAAGVPIYDGSSICQTENMVTVTGNYRINFLGGAFLGGGINGNFHIKDQQLILKWVKNNIAAFGGDPSNVVIFGQSAGGMSVTTHMTVPSSWPLFNSALSLSNPIGQMWRTPEVALKISAVILKNISCPNDGGMNMINCVRNTSYHKLVAAALDKKAMIAALLPLTVEQVMVPWAPVVDGDFIPMQPTTALATGKFHKEAPFVISTVRNESNEFLRDLWPGDNFGKLDFELLEGLMWANLSLARNVNSFYWPNGVPQLRDLHLTVDPAFTDALFYAPSVHFGRLAAEFGKIYQVMYTYYSPAFTFMYKKHEKYCRLPVPAGYLPPICHADDLLGYFWSMAAIKADGYYVPDAILNPPAAERQLSKTMQGIIGGLAYNKNPGAQIPPLTPKSSGLPAQLYNLSIPCSVETNYRGAEVAFWDKQGYRRF